MLLPQHTVYLQIIYQMDLAIFVVMDGNRGMGHLSKFVMSKVVLLFSRYRDKFMYIFFS